MALGKSTFARILAGIDKPTSGEVLLDNINTKSKKDFIDIRKNIGIVFQNPENQIVFSKVFDDIAFTLNNLGIKKEEQEERICESLEKVDMSAYIKEDSHELSLGQKQRIAIAGVLATKPQIIIFDEPTTMIDSEGKVKIYKILKQLQKEGHTIIYITNIIDEIILADRVIVMDNGQVAHRFELKSITENEEIFERYGIEKPFIIKLSKKLKERNIEISLDELKDWV
jgi:energy-coupling factor transport system ATP-binding protein